MHCVDGFEVYIDGTTTGKTCLDACGGENNTKCCAGDVGSRYIPGLGLFVLDFYPDACENFTGSVCSDGSCMGFEGECPCCCFLIDCYSIYCLAEHSF